MSSTWSSAFSFTLDNGDHGLDVHLMMICHYLYFPLHSKVLWKHHWNDHGMSPSKDKAPKLLNSSHTSRGSQFPTLNYALKGC